jgi:signal transduction histidine kinase
VLWAALAIFVSLPARAQDHIVSRAFFEDRSGLQTIHEVREASFVPFASVLSQGYGAAPVWIRLRLDPSASDASAETPLYLRIRPAYLDELQIYDPLIGFDAPMFTGDRVPLTKSSEPATAFVVRLSAGSAARDIFIRLASTSTRLAHFEVVTSTELRRDTSRLDHLGAIYLTVLGVFLLWGVVQVLSRPNVLLVTFLVFQACTFAFSLGMLGYIRFYLSDHLSSAWIDFSTSLPAVAATGAVMFFCVQLLKEISDYAWYRRAEQLILISYAVLMALMLFGVVRPILALNMAMVLIVPITVLVLSLLVPQSVVRPQGNDLPQARLPRFVVVGFFGVSCLFTLMTALPALGLLPGAEISLYIVLFYALTSGLLMVSVLYYRGLILLRRQTALASEAENQRLRAEQERKNRLERERLLAMLGHELKTPLATMRMLLMDREIPEKTAQRIQSSVTDMAHVVERTVQTSQVEDGAIEVHMADCEVVALVDDLRTTVLGKDRIELVHAEGATLRTRTDPYLLQVILRNLLDNALKYSAADAPVRIIIDSVNAANKWCITVSNRPGHAGWPDRQKVFEKYYRSPTASHRSGSGLGLYMIQGLAKTLGGRVVYEPDAQWVRFRLEVTHSPMKES